MLHRLVLGLFFAAQLACLAPDLPMGATLHVAPDDQLLKDVAWARDGSGDRILVLQHVGQGEDLALSQTRLVIERRHPHGEQVWSAWVPIEPTTVEVPRLFASIVSQRDDGSVLVAADTTGRFAGVHTDARFLIEVTGGGQVVALTPLPTYASGSSYATPVLAAELPNGDVVFFGGSVECFSPQGELKWFHNVASSAIDLSVLPDGTIGALASAGGTSSGSSITTGLEVVRLNPDGTLRGSHTFPELASAQDVSGFALDAHERSYLAVRGQDLPFGARRLLPEGGVVLLSYEPDGRPGRSYEVAGDGFYSTLARNGDHLATISCDAPCSEGSAFHVTRINSVTGAGSTVNEAILYQLPVGARLDLSARGILTGTSVLSRARMVARGTEVEADAYDVWLWATSL